MEIYQKYQIQQYKTIFLNLKQTNVYYFLKSIGISENHIKNLRKNSSSILVNGRFATTRTKLCMADVLEILKSPNCATKTKLCDGKLEILFEDEDFLIVNKPSGLACTPTRSHFDMNLGGQICKYMLPKDPNFVLRILNRLDLDTAGIVVVAKNPIAYNNVKLEKEYHALAKGNIYKNITIDKPILTKNENGYNQIKREISENGKQATTYVEVVKNYKDYCHIKLKLKTGRTHQIRVHLSSIGHPLIGDKLYGEKDDDACHTMLLLKNVKLTNLPTLNSVELQVNFPDDWQTFLDTNA